MPFVKVTAMRHSDRRDFFMEWEFAVLNAIQKMRTPFLDKLMPCITFLGQWAILWIVIAVLCLAFKQKRKLGISLLFDIIINTVVCNLIFKNIVQRLRPYILNESFRLLIPPERDYFSFPSGHSMLAFGAATIIFIYNKKVGICMYFLAALIAFSRLYLYMHFPTDVMIGSGMGVLLAIFSYKIEKHLLVKPDIRKIKTAH